jgi:phospholipid/cholesterol/gamma-HCH transport system substrate-binding protein
MKPFADRNHKTLGAVAMAVILVAVGLAVNSSRLAFFSSSRNYHADLGDAGSLVSGEQITVAGTRVGAITALHLEGDHVRMDFTVRPGVHLGSLTGLAVKVLSPLGQEYVQLTSAGPGQLAPGATIPESRTVGTQTILSTLNRTGQVLGAINDQQVSQSLKVLDQDLSGTSPAATAAVISGLGRLSNVIVGRQSELAALVNEANTVTATLNAHRGQLIDLIGQGNLILQVVQERQADIKQVLDATTALSNEVSGIITNKQADLSALLTNLDTAAGVLAKDSGTLTNALPLLSGLATYLANASGSGPYFDAVSPTLLLDDHLVQQCDQPGAVPAYSVLSHGCNA